MLIFNLQFDTTIIENNYWHSIVAEFRTAEKGNPVDAGYPEYYGPYTFSKILVNALSRAQQRDFDRDSSRADIVINSVNDLSSKLMWCVFQMLIPCRFIFPFLSTPFWITFSRSAVRGSWRPISTTTPAPRPPWRAPTHPSIWPHFRRRAERVSRSSRAESLSLNGKCWTGSMKRCVLYEFFLGSLIQSSMFYGN